MMYHRPLMKMFKNISEMLQSVTRETKILIGNIETIIREFSFLTKSRISINKSWVFKVLN
jgi:hypothetical protein